MVSRIQRRGDSSISCSFALIFNLFFQDHFSFSFCWINTNDVAVRADAQTPNTNHRFKGEYFITVCFNRTYRLTRRDHKQGDTQTYQVHLCSQLSVCVFPIDFWAICLHLKLPLFLQLRLEHVKQFEDIYFLYRNKMNVPDVFQRARTSTTLMTN